LAKRASLLRAPLLGYVRGVQPRVSSPAKHERAQTVVRWLVVASAALILYGSLFPFRFDAPVDANLGDLLTGLRFQRTSRGDLVANLLLYMPLGLCLMLALPIRWSRFIVLAWTVVAGTALSTAIELLQFYSPMRVSSLTDVVINAIGTLAGALAAIIYLELGSTLRIPGIAAGRPEPVPLGVLLLWLAFRLAPFVPTIDWQKYKDAVKPLFLEPSFGVLDTFRYVVGWLVVGYTVRQLWRREYALFALLAIVGIVLAGRIVVVGKVLVASELLALAICIPLAAVIVANPDRLRTALLAALLAATVVLHGLKPFELLAQPQEFSWVPFKNSLSDSLEVNYSVLLEKCFWYFSLVWLLARRGSGVGRAALATAALLGAIEAAQLWLPGRSAEITDPLLALAAGVLLALLGTRPATSIRLPK
jgi:VanZ family protein